MQGTVLVTGTSRGIGRATVRRLGRAGFRVIGTVRTEPDAKELVSDADGDVRAALLDLADDRSIERLTDNLQNDLGVATLDGVVHVAAAAGRAIPMAHITRADLDTHSSVTAAGTAVLTAAVIPMLTPGAGRIVYVGAGPLSMPLLGAGFAAKQALEAIADVTRVELRGIGIRVSVVEPGMTLWDDAEAQLSAYNSALDEGVEAVPAADRDRYRRAAGAFKEINRRFIERGASADTVAEKIEHALTARRPRRRYYCGWEQKAATALDRAAPTALKDRVLRSMLKL